MFLQSKYLPLSKMMLSSVIPLHGIMELGTIYSYTLLVRVFYFTETNTSCISW